MRTHKQTLAAPRHPGIASTQSCKWTVRYSPQAGQPAAATQEGLQRHTSRCASPRRRVRLVPHGSGQTARRRVCCGAARAGSRVCGPNRPLDRKLRVNAGWTTSPSPLSAHNVLGRLKVCGYERPRPQSCRGKAAPPFWPAQTETCACCGGEGGPAGRRGGARGGCAPRNRHRCVFLCPCRPAAPAFRHSVCTLYATGVVPYTNKQRVLVFSTRGITARYRHLMEDLRNMLPHHKKEVKVGVLLLCGCIGKSRDAAGVRTQAREWGKDFALLLDGQWHRRVFACPARGL